ncbi:bile acid:sodium symporter family protein [Sphingomonas sp. AR_OL41]|uniref:bile acid:sodium symporter family protein n=1 Tax=Sphingomonas sp. AR_OL41 TaxID=3042729 RepID=UPI00247FFC6E|nr:bile acid:sodium symporter family protein [Sphingomonas sp. AR_OL41]MDH7972081.1 bile acid:sodium symporter family protein [Sphingomonas sp. AR_OL41]
MKIDGFLLAMLAAVLLAFVAPWFGAAGGPLHIDQVTAIGIALVFFLHGANLSPEALKSGAANWRIHFAVQATTFILFPLIGFAVFFGLAPLLAYEVRLGVFFLCALSSTISSSVAMTSLARGNVPAAIFDASLSGVLGMIITPTLVAIVVKVSGQSFPILPAIANVALTLLVPFALGQLARPLVKAWLSARKPLINKLDRGVIILIVYGAFCESTASGLWWRYSPWLIGEIALLAGLLLAMILWLTTRLSQVLGLTLPDEVTTVFCGSKKSLANGAPIAKILFAGNPALGMIMLPIMLYHQLQLIACSALARRYAARAEDTAE